MKNLIIALTLLSPATLLAADNCTIFNKDFSEVAAADKLSSNADFEVDDGVSSTDRFFHDELAKLELKGWTFVSHLSESKNELIYTTESGLDGQEAVQVLNNGCVADMTTTLKIKDLEKPLSKEVKGEGSLFKILGEVPPLLPTADSNRICISWKKSVEDAVEKFPPCSKKD